MGNALALVRIKTTGFDSVPMKNFFHAAKNSGYYLTLSAYSTIELSSYENPSIVYWRIRTLCTRDILLFFSVGCKVSVFRVLLVMCADGCGMCPRVDAPLLQMYLNPWGPTMLVVFSRICSFSLLLYPSSYLGSSYWFYQFRSVYSAKREE